ncbi:hypothetical protein CK203_108030 [Vitis vinifera]|uniref:Uncharacterized protein n=1 Tax=Vitis vinifera TaxID=29760 RepID=A0A438D363_VITVI|nr:hypothetical protein CK203_108030 [Vitis vinifera]
MGLKKGGLTTLKGLRVDQNLMALGAVGSMEEGQHSSPNLSKRGPTQATDAGTLKGLRAPEVKVSDESLLEEVAKYSSSEPRSSLSFGGWGSPSSSSFSKGDKAMVVVDRGLRDLDGIEGGEAVVDPLRVIWADGSERGAASIFFWGGGGGGAKAMVGKEFLDRVLGNRLEEDEEGVAEPWLNSSFVTSVDA